MAAGRPGVPRSIETRVGAAPGCAARGEAPAAGPRVNATAGHPPTGRPAAPSGSPGNVDTTHADDRGRSTECRTGSTPGSPDQPNSASAPRHCTASIRIGEAPSVRGTTRDRGGPGPGETVRGRPGRDLDQKLDRTWTGPRQLLRPSHDLSTVSTALSTAGGPSRCRLYRPGSRRTVDNMALPGRADRQPCGVASEVRLSAGRSAAVAWSRDLPAVRRNRQRLSGPAHPRGRGQPFPTARGSGLAITWPLHGGAAGVARRRNFSTCAPGVMISDAVFIVTHLTEAG